MSPRTPNPHLAMPIVHAGCEPGAARLRAVLIHGRDQDEAVMLDLAMRVGLADIAYLLPLAAGRSWYPGRYFDPRATLEPHLGWSLEALERAVAAAGAAEERIVLGGFSQGACLVAEFAARRPRAFAGVAVLTGSLLGSAAERPLPRVRSGLRMSFASSRHDAWISLGDARDTAERFAAAGARTAFTELEDRVHHVSDRAVDALARLLAPEHPDR